MLCESFTSWRRLHAVKDCRLKRFKHAPAAQNQVRTIIREIDASALAPEDIRLLDDLLDGYGANVRHIMDLLKTRRYRRFCHGNLYQEFRKTLRAEHRAMQEKLPEEERAAHPLALGGMQGKVWKVSVEYTCALYDRYWRGIQVRALQELRRKPFYQALTRAEQYYVACLLKSTGGMFFDMLDGRVPKPPAFPKSIQGSVAHAGALCAKVRATVRKLSRHLPVHGQNRSCVLAPREGYHPLRKSAPGDADGISIITAIPRRTVKVRVKGRGPIKKTIVLVRDGDRFFLHLSVPLKVKPLEKVPSAPAGYSHCTALDMGFTEVFTDDGGRQYGGGLGVLLTRMARELDDHCRKRRALWAAYRKAGPRKWQRLLKFNLGKKRWESRRERARREVENLINRALNHLLASRPSDVYLVEQFAESFDYSGMSREVRRRLSGWMRGVIADRLAFKVAERGARLVYVPANYTSQRCPVCSFVRRDQRSGDRFHCKHCGHKAQADGNAALNLLLAAHEPKIKRGMTCAQVDTVYRTEYEKKCRTEGKTPLPRRLRTSKRSAKGTCQKGNVK